MSRLKHYDNFRFAWQKIAIIKMLVIVMQYSWNHCMGEALMNNHHERLGLSAFSFHIGLDLGQCSARLIVASLGIFSLYDDRQNILNFTLWSSRKTIITLSDLLKSIFSHGHSTTFFQDIRPPEILITC